MGAWRKIMEPQKPGNSPGPGPEVKEKPSVVKERAAKGVRSWTVQNETRGVLGRVSADAERWILNSREMNLTEGCVRCSEDEREHSERDEGAQFSQWKPREFAC